MGTRRILVVLAAALATGLLATSTAQAGNWAETVLDPTPAKIESTVTYTFGFWVLQHGSYPYQGGDLGPVALTATDEDGNEVVFPATKSATAGHYSAEVVFPHDSRWHLGARHQALMNDANIATVTVPGAVKITSSEVRQRAAHEWGVVRPSFPPTADDAQIAAPGSFSAPKTTTRQPAERPVEPRAQVSTDEPGEGLPIELVVAGVLALVAAAVWLARRNARRSTG